MNTALVWFRRDLRLADNPALQAALAGHDEVIPVYIHAADEEAPWPPGGAQRVWLHHSLEAFDAELRKRGSSLVLRPGPDSLQALRRLVAETGARAVYWNRLYEPAVIARDTRVKQALREDGLQVESFNAALLREPWELQTRQGGPYRVYTPFSRALRQSGVAAPGETARLPPLARKIVSAPLDSFGLLPKIRWDRPLITHWTPGEQAARKVLRGFLAQGLAQYREGRNLPGEAGVSRLSPHLHFGEIGPRQIWHAVESHVAQDASPGMLGGAETYLNEIIWREFAHHLLYHFPHTTDQPLDARFTRFPWAEPSHDTLTAWHRGQTGIPIVDAGMRELWQTGWMHNRVRMIVASLLTKNLLLPWQEGSRWFWDTLLDADLASNTLGWQWTAGCGADAAPYFRIFNPVLQGARFDAGGVYLRRWLPELAKLPNHWINSPWSAPEAVLTEAGIRLGSSYPKPIVDLAESRQRALSAYQSLRAESGN